MSNSASNVSVQRVELNDMMTTPMSDILLTPLNELQVLSQSLFQSLGPPQSKPPPAPPISAFVGVDKKLANSVQLSRFHQVKQRKIELLKDEVLELDMQWRNIVQELESGKRELETIVAEGEERIKSIEQADAGTIRSSARCSHFNNNEFSCDPVS